MSEEKQIQRLTAQYNAVVEQNRSLQQELQQKNRALKEIEEIAKTKIYTPVCFEAPDCPKNCGIGFDNDCKKYCPLIMLEKILEKIKEVRK